MPLLSSVRNSGSIVFFNLLIYFIDNKVYQFYTNNGYIAKVLVCHKSNAVHKYSFEWLFIYLYLIWIEISNIDHVVKKVKCTSFYIYFFQLITHFLDDIMICGLVINVFVLMDFYDVKVLIINTNIVINKKASKIWISLC